MINKWWMINDIFQARPFSVMPLILVYESLTLKHQVWGFWCGSTWPCQPFLYPESWVARPWDWSSRRAGGYKRRCKDNNKGLKDLDRKQLAAVMMERKKIIREHNVKVKERLHQDTEKLKKDDSNTVLKCPECEKDVHRGSLRRHREELCLKSRV